MFDILYFRVYGKEKFYIMKTGKSSIIVVFWLPNGDGTESFSFYLRNTTSLVLDKQAFSCGLYYAKDQTHQQTEGYAYTEFLDTIWDDIYTFITKEGDASTHIVAISKKVWEKDLKLMVGKLFEEETMTESNNAISLFIEEIPMQKEEIAGDIFGPVITETQEGQKITFVLYADAMEKYMSATKKIAPDYLEN